MPNPNQAPQPEQPEIPAVQSGEFDHLLGRGPEQHLKVEDAAVRPVDEGAISRTRAEVERMQKLGDLNTMDGPIPGPKSKPYEQ